VHTTLLLDFFLSLPGSTILAGSEEFNPFTANLKKRIFTVEVGF